jgi:hypothetical protein
MKEYEKLKLTKEELRGKIERNEPMAIEELERLNAHNINGIRIIVNTVFVITIIIPAIIGFVFGLNWLFNSQ